MTTTSIATLERTIDWPWVGDHDGHRSSSDANVTSTNIPSRVLRLAFLGCEVLPPYGPYEHTAELFADLIAKAWSTSISKSSSSSGLSDKNKNNHQTQKPTLVLEVFGVSKSSNSTDGFTSIDLKDFDGVILPGSFSSAYDMDTPWIRALGEMIQTELVAKNIPTLGICFGHQLYAHSFSRTLLTAPNSGERKGGIAVKCPAGPQAGKKTIKLTPSGRAFLSWANDDNENEARNDACNSNTDEMTTNNGSMYDLDLFYTHGDMVESLPSRGVSLGGNERVPIQAAVYFSYPLLAGEAETILRETGNNEPPSVPRVIAVTFQAHPEFACLGGQTKGGETLGKIVDLMRNNGDLGDNDYQAAVEDVRTSGESVNQQSLETMVAAGRLLGWFR